MQDYKSKCTFHFTIIILDNHYRSAQQSKTIGEIMVTGKVVIVALHSVKTKSYMKYIFNMNYKFKFMVIAFPLHLKLFNWHSFSTY